MPATKTPPMIAPGVLCPKCKGPMTDERANKRTEKSPDYQCANVTCTDKTGKYRTGVWLEKNGSGAEAPSQSAGGEMGKPTAGTPSAAPSAEPAPTPEMLRGMKAAHAEAMKHCVQYVLDKIEPLYKARNIGLTGDEVYKHAYSIYRSWEDGGFIR